jgi:drug/metabolite transporter (DMT)-like permease
VAILAQPVLDCAVTHARAIVSLHLAVALFGFAGLFGAWLHWPPAEITLGRCVVAALALAVVTRARGERLRPSVALFVNGAILALHWTSFFAAIRTSGIAIGLLGYASFPLFVVLLERVLLARPFDRASLLAMALVTAGLILVAGFRYASSVPVTGLAWGIVSGATFAWLAVRNREHVRTLPAAALAHTLFIASMRALSAHTASIIAALEPVYGIALAVLLVHQVPDRATLAGGVLIVSAAVAASRRPGGAV